MIPVVDRLRGRIDTQTDEIEMLRATIHTALEGIYDRDRVIRRLAADRANALARERRAKRAADRARESAHAHQRLARIPTITGLQRANNYRKGTT